MDFINLEIILLYSSPKLLAWVIRHVCSTALLLIFLQNTLHLLCLSGIHYPGRIFNQAYFPFPENSEAVNSLRASKLFWVPEVQNILLHYFFWLSLSLTGLFVGFLFRQYVRVITLISLCCSTSIVWASKPPASLTRLCGHSLYQFSRSFFQVPPLPCSFSNK